MEQKKPTKEQVSAYFRKPELKIALPSKGRFYPPGALELDPTGEVDVYPMTAIDELTLKTPDALLTGESTIKVIQSCVPAIKNAWLMPASDVDTLLIAIRIATYGPRMTLTSRVPVTGTQQSHEIDLQKLFDNVDKTVPNNQCLLDNGVKITLTPNNYQQVSLIRRSTFEKQKLARTINDAKLKDEEKQEEFNKIFAELTRINVETLVNNIDSIILPEGSITDKNDINDFIQNVDLKFVTAVRKQLEVINKLGSFESFKAESPEEDVKKGAPKTYQVPILLDNSDFFVS
ncbi:hypothetical protein CL622_00910 [archaeon]|nr:hypothetical protein [archaeon]